MKYDLRYDGEYEVRVQRRERRLADKQRMKAKAKRIGRREKEADHLAVCSCSMCCNGRRNEWVPAAERLTMQERRRLEA